MAQQGFVGREGEVAVCHTVSDARAGQHCLPRLVASCLLLTTTCNRTSRRYNDNRKRKAKSDCPEDGSTCCGCCCCCSTLVKGHLSGVSNATKLTLEPQHLIQLSTQGSHVQSLSRMRLEGKD